MDRRAAVQPVDLDSSGPEETADARLHQLDMSRFPLVSRGFHWINERPFNR